MKKDGVNTAFDLVLEDMSKVIDKIKAEIAKQTEDGRYDEAQKAMAVCKDLDALRSEVSELRKHWIEGCGTSRTAENSVHPLAQRRSSGKRGPDKKLFISFPETGQRIDGPIAARNFAEAIRLMRIEEVKKLDLKRRKRSKASLITEQRGTDKNSESRIKVGNCYILTKSTTEEKKTTLETIARKLGIKIRVEVI